MSTVTRKGQVTVPKKVRDYLGLKTGSSVSFERLPSGEIVLRSRSRVPKPQASAFARLRGRASIRMSTAEILALTRGL